MLKTYTGHYINGNFVLPAVEQAQIPNNVSILFTVLDEATTNLKSSPEDEKHVAARLFLNAIRELRKNGFTKEDDTAISELQSGAFKPVFSERL